MFLLGHPQPCLRQRHGVAGIAVRECPRFAGHRVTVAPVSPTQIFLLQPATESFFYALLHVKA